MANNQSSKMLGRTFNVHGNPTTYRWTISKRPEILQQVPYITLIEHRQDMSALLSTAGRFAYLGDQAFKIVEEAFNSAVSNLSIDPMQKLPYDPYKGLYAATPTKNSYIFPWFSDYHHQITSTWDDNSGILSTLASKAAEFTTKYISPAGGMDVPKMWSSIDPGTFQFEFSLINTDFESEEQVQGINNHMDLIDCLIFANLPIKTSFMTSLPPCIYEMYIPGIRCSPVCIINNLQIDNVGQLNRLNLRTEGRIDCIVPDEWKIRILITELVRESNLIYQGIGVEAKDRVKAISLNTLKDVLTTGNTSTTLQNINNTVQKYNPWQKVVKIIKD